MIIRTWLVFCVLLCGCASEWRTEEVVTPSTYATTSYRSATSIGRLSTMAVMRAEVYIDAEPEQEAVIERRTQLSRELQASVAEFLITQKGYDVRVADASVRFEDAAAIRKTGQHLGVDGIVIVERWIARPWSTAKGIMNVFLLNIPLFQAMSTTHLRISIYETASGRIVWKSELRGENSSDSVSLPHALGDLENAVPQLLRRQ